MGRREARLFAVALEHALWGRLAMLERFTDNNKIEHQDAPPERVREWRSARAELLWPSSNKIGDAGLRHLGDALGKQARFPCSTSPEPRR